MSDPQVVIVGAGSVGLMLANLLGQKGVQTLILDRKPAVEDSSKAIGISPTSLEIFAKLGLDRAMAEAGRQVKTVRLFGTRQPLGQLNFDGLDSDYKFILALPQGKTEAILAANLSKMNTVTLLRGWEVTDTALFADRALVTARHSVTGELREWNCAWLVACDGGKSSLRQRHNLPFRGHPYKDTFLMGDFEDHTGWGSEARLHFTGLGSIESFPLPGGLRRYVLSTPEFIPENTTDYLRREVPRRGGPDLSTSRQAWESAFGVQRFSAPEYARGRLILCGDAAHLMSPIVGQNMNTGFGDAEFLAEILPEMLNNPAMGVPKLQNYGKLRRRAAAGAADRAWFMMRLGTSRGRFWTLIRSPLVWLALHSPLKVVLPRIFSMVSIPFVNLRRRKL